MAEYRSTVQWARSSNSRAELGLRTSASAPAGRMSLDDFERTFGADSHEFPVRRKRRRERPTPGMKTFGGSKSSTNTFLQTARLTQRSSKGVRQETLDRLPTISRSVASSPTGNKANAIGKQKSKYNLPTNICFNSEPVNEYEILKKGTFKWFPIINSSKSLAIITNSSFIKDYNKKAKIKMTIYKVDSEDIIDKIIELKPYEQYELIIDNKISTFLDNKSGWVTLTSNNPFVRSWYFDFNKSGIMGGDHTF